MAARIPQLYQPTRPRAGTVSRATPPPVAPESANPFATPNGSATDLSTTQGGNEFSSIGNLLMSSSNDDDNERRPAPKPESVPVMRTGRARAGTVANDGYVQVDRDMLQSRIRSQAGMVEESGEDFSDYDFDDDEGVSSMGHSVGQPGVATRATSSPAVSSPVGATPMVFPTPSIGPSSPARSSPTTPVGGNANQNPFDSPPLTQRSMNQGPPAPTPMRPNANGPYQQPSPPMAPPLQIPSPFGRNGAAGPPPGPQSIMAAPPRGASLRTPSPGRPETPVQAHLKANGQAPVSPMLAAPPRAHFANDAMRSPGENTDPANLSIKGYDAMRQKNSMFREGQEEIFTPFSPRARQAGPRAPRNGSGLKTVSRISTMDLWKRISRAQHLEETEKESSWIKTQRRSVWTKPKFVFPLVLSIIAVGIIIAVVTIKVRQQKSVV